MEKSFVEVEDLLDKSKKVAQGQSLATAGIDTMWLSTYAENSRRCFDDEEFGLSRYPYEPEPTVAAFTGGFIENKQFPMRLALKKKSSMKMLANYEAHYPNAKGYWLLFLEDTVQLFHEEIEEKETDKASKFDVRALVSVRYALRVVGLRTEFYKIAADDPVTAKIILPDLERRMDLPAADDMVEMMDKLNTNLNTGLMKAVCYAAIQ